MKTEVTSKDTPFAKHSTPNGLHPGSDFAAAAVVRNDTKEAGPDLSAYDESGEVHKQHAKHSLPDGSGLGHADGGPDAEPDDAVLESAPSSPSSSIEVRASQDQPDNIF